MPSSNAETFRRFTRSVFEAQTALLKHGDVANAGFGQSSARPAPAALTRSDTPGKPVQGAHSTRNSARQVKRQVQGMCDKRFGSVRDARPRSRPPSRRRPLCPGDWGAGPPSSPSGGQVASTTRSSGIRVSSDGTPWPGCTPRSRPRADSATSAGSVQSVQSVLAASPATQPRRPAPPR